MKIGWLVRLVISACLVSMSLLVAAVQSSAQSSPMTMSQSKSSTKKTKPVALGAMAQMGRTTKKQRMEAAVRHADRRAARIRKNRAEVK